MPDVRHGTGRRVARHLVVAAALSAALVSCGRMEDRAVSASAGALPPPASALPAPTAASKFQGSVTSVDADGAAFVVGVRIVWTPVLDATAHDRRVVVDPGTRWDPGVTSVRDLRVGDEVQVEADPAGDGWRASRVQLFDID